MTTEPLRIAMISYYLPSGSKIGVGHQVHALANALAERGHDVTVFSACGPVDGARYRHRLVGLTGRLRTFRFALAVRRVDFDSFDVLHAHGDDYWLWRRRARAHIRTLHGSCFEEARHITGLRERLRMVALGFSELLASLVADVTVVVSPQTRRWTPWVRRVIPNGVDLARFADGGEERSPVPSVLFVGTWNGRKRGRLLAEQFVRDTLPAVPDAELWMVTGDVPSDSHPSVHGLGSLSDADLASTYRRAWVFCLPSSYEGFGIPYVEAMAAGTPVVASPNPGARYVSNDGADAILCADAELGRELGRVLTDAELRRSLAVRGRERVGEFALDAVADRYEQLYRETAVRRRT